MKLTDKKNTVIMISCTIILFVFNIRNVGNLISPSILFDEFGYWTSAALWNGLDWSGVTSALVPYYSYGYGFLLALVIFIAPDMEQAYQLAIVLNSIMICLSFIISYKIITEITDRVSKTYIMLFCFIAEFYPSIIHHSQFAWSETVIMFSFWVCMFLFLKLLTTQKLFYFVLFGGISVYLYVIHQRNIAILLMAIFIALLMRIKKLVKGKALACFILTVAILLVGHMAVKEIITERLWNNNQINVQNLVSDNQQITNIENDVVAANDYKGQFGKIKFIFSAEGIKCLIMGFLGKVYYLGLSSVFIAYEGFYYIFERLRDLLNKEKDNRLYLNIFALGAFLGTLMVSSIFMVYPTRIDTVAYGRYTDCLLGIFIIYGLINIVHSNRTALLKRLCIYCGFILGFQLLFTLFIDKYALWFNFATCSPITNWFREYFKCDVIWVPVMALTAVLLGLAAACFINNKRMRVFGLVFLPLTWVLLTSSAIKADIVLSKSEEMQELKNLLLSTGSDSEDIYYIYGTNPTMDIYVGSIQFLLNDKTVKCVDIETVKDIQSNCLILLPIVDVENHPLDNSMVYEKGSTLNFRYLIKK